MKKIILYINTFLLISCATKPQICKRNDNLNYDKFNSKLELNITYFPNYRYNNNTLFESINQNNDFKKYVYQKLNSYGINDQSIKLESVAYERYLFKLNNINQYQFCDISNIQIETQKKLNTKYISYFSVLKADENLFNADTEIVPFNPMRLHFVNFNDKFKEIGYGAYIYNYLYYDNEDKLHQKIYGNIDYIDFNFDIFYSERSNLKIDNYIIQIQNKIIK